MTTTFGKLPTLTTLNDALAENGFNKVVTRDNCETYGRTTMAYIRLADMAQRYSAEMALEAAGFKVDRRYWPEKPIVEVRVSYLKAFGWDK